MVALAAPAWCGDPVLLPMADFVRKFQAHEHMVVLDARTQAEYLTGHIPGAVNIPLSQFEQDQSSLPRDQFLVVTCGCCEFSKCPTVVPAAKKLLDLGFTNLAALQLPLGLDSWEEAGLPLEMKPHTIGETASSSETPAKLLVIGGKGIQDPNEAEVIRRLVGTFPDLNIERHKVESEVGKNSVKTLKLKYFPAYILSKEIEKSNAFAALDQAQVLRKSKDFYVLSPRMAKPAAYPFRKKETGVLHLFVMSQCPFGVNALQQLTTAQQQQQITPTVRFRVHYLATAAPGEKVPFSSLHGSSELEEDLRQLVIQKYFPDRFFPYLKARNKDYHSPQWEPAAQEAGLDAARVAKLAQKRGLKLLAKDVRLGDELDIHVSPSFLWENQTPVYDLPGLKEIPEFKDFTPQPFKGGCGQK